MFKIYDGRKYFYQWDINQRLIVDDSSITEVHFCNRTGECSLVCEVYKENGLNLVNVPNILFHNYFDIYVYAYDGNCTKHSKRFGVMSRSKPADYVYTETEVKSWEELAAKVEELAKNGGGFKVVHKPEVWTLEKGAYKVTGGFIFESESGGLEGPAWGNASNSVSFREGYLFVMPLPYSFSNVSGCDFYAIAPYGYIYYGRITLIEEIDSITGDPTLVANCDFQSLSKTKSISSSSTDGEFPTAAAVYKYVNSQLSGGNNSGSGNTNKVYEKIATITVTADESGNLPSSISITKDDNGDAFELTDIYCDMSIGLTDGTSGKLYIKAGNAFLMGNLNAYFLTALRKWFFRYDSYGEGLGGLCIAPANSISAGNFPTNQNYSLVGQPVQIGETLNINSLTLTITVGTAKTFLEGTTLTLWGVRK